MKRIIAFLFAAVFCLTLFACGGGADVPADTGAVSTETGTVQDPPVTETEPENSAPVQDVVASGTIDVERETGSVTVEYYDGTEIVNQEQDGNLLVQVPAGSRLENINIFAAEGEVVVVGVIADHYDIETVGGDITIYLPEGTAFHVMLATIRDIFESDFLYDVTMTKHEYIYLTDGLDIQLETVIGIARVMMLQE